MLASRQCTCKTEQECKDAFERQEGNGSTSLWTISWLRIAVPATSVVVIMVDHAGIILLISQHKCLHQDLGCRVGEFSIGANVMLRVFCRVIRGECYGSAPGPSDEVALVTIRLCFLRSTNDLSAGPCRDQLAILPCLPMRDHSRPGEPKPPRGSSTTFVMRPRSLAVVHSAALDRCRPI